MRDSKGRAAQELIVSAQTWEQGQAYLERAGARPVQVQLISDGVIDQSTLGADGVRAAAARHEASRAELPYAGWRLSAGDPAVPVKMVDIFLGDD